MRELGVFLVDIGAPQTCGFPPPKTENQKRWYLPKCALLRAEQGMHFMHHPKARCGGRGRVWILGLPLRDRSPLAGSQGIV